jgi:3-oxoacyl-[acyl-carrier protein] reductase
MAQHAIVTGGARGIGAAITQGLLDRGDKVAVFDVSPPPAGSAASFYEVDVSNMAAVQAAVDEVAFELGCVDVLVNCAGINRDKVSWKMSEAQWDEVIAVDLKGCFTTVRAVAGLMKAQRRGRVVNISSINGLRGKFGQVNYAAAKAGVIGLTKALAKELGAFDVTVNAVCPGLVMTDMVRAAPASVTENALQEMVVKVAPTPEDVANAVLFLASDAARRITGEVIRVDSGQYI